MIIRNLKVNATNRNGKAVATGFSVTTIENGFRNVREISQTAAKRIMETAKQNNHLNKVGKRDFTVNLTANEPHIIYNFTGFDINELGG
jgi:hypothetical protein